MGERLHHVRDNKCSLCRIAMLLEFVPPGSDRQQESAVKAHGEFLLAAGPMGDLCEEQLMEFRVGLVGLNHRLDQRAHQFVER